MFGSRDFPTSKWKFALNLQCVCTSHYRKTKIEQWNALSTALIYSFNAFTVEIGSKVRNSLEPNIAAF